MNPLQDFVDALGLDGVWTWLIVFLAASVLLIWRLEALLEQGLEGTALGTVVIPYCSGLGNLLFVAVVQSRGIAPVEIATNSIVNNATNLTFVLGLPLIVWGLNLRPGSGSRRRSAAAEMTGRLNRLTLLLTFFALIFFTGVTWVLGRDGSLDRNDGLALVGLFLFWQCFQVYDVLKHSIRKRVSFGPRLLIDAAIVLICAYGLYVSLEWLVAWVSDRTTGFFSATHLGWLSGWLLVLPNAIVAFYYAVTRRPDVVYASQVGDCHICIPLCVGIGAILRPIPIEGFLLPGLLLVCGTAVVHAAFIAITGGPPRWFGWLLLAFYAGFVGTGFGG